MDTQKSNAEFQLLPMLTIGCYPLFYKALALKSVPFPQDPNDEPASVLLERIKAEKAAQANPSKKSKRQKT